MWGVGYLGFLLGVLWRGRRGVLVVGCYVTCCVVAIVTQRYTEDTQRFTEGRGIITQRAQRFAKGFGGE